MGEKTLNIRIKNKYDTEANWTKNNPVLLAGETAYSSDKSGKYKIGDGTHKWSELSYAKANLVKSDVTTALGYTPPTNNTWRGIQNNLTSDSATDSLAAAQGKVLKGLVDGKLPLTGGTLTGSLIIKGNAASQPLQVRGIVGSDGNGTVGILHLQYGTNQTIALGNTGAYTISADGSLYSGTASKANAAPWSGITGKPTSYPPSSHTHNYAGSGSAGGAANSANKLAASRTVSGGTDITLSFNYDGSGNSNANIGYYGSSANVGDSNHYPFHRFAKLDTITASYSDKSTTFFISQDYNGGGFGIVRIVLRTNNSSSLSSVEVKWMVRCGLSADSVQVGIYNVFGKTYADAFFKTGGSYAGTYFRAIASGSRGNVSRTWVMVNSSEVSGTTASDAKTSTECYATIAAAGTALHKQAYSTIVSGTDSGTTSYANSAGSVAWGNVSGRPSSMPASDVPAWAKATSKPTYSKSEVGLGNVDNTADSAKSVKYATTAGSANAVTWANVSGKPAITGKQTRTLTASGPSGWKDATTDQAYVPDMAFMAYWNGAYSGSSSNLAYCNRGAFGTIVTKNTGDYATAGHTHNYAGSSSAGGNANAAVKLATARTINGTSFDGSANITTANWGTARTIGVGNTSKSVNGSANVSWSLAEIGVHVSTSEPTASDGQNGDIWIVYE